MSLKCTRTVHKYGDVVQHTIALCLSHDSGCTVHSREKKVLYNDLFFLFQSTYLNNRKDKEISRQKLHIYHEQKDFHRQFSQVNNKNYHFMMIQSSYNLG